MFRRLVVLLVFTLLTTVPSFACPADSSLDSPCMSVGHTPILLPKIYKGKVTNGRQQLQRAMGIPMRYSKSSTPCAYAEEVLTFKHDIVEVPLIWVPYLVEQLDYRPVLTSNRTYNAVIVSSVNNPIRNLEQLIQTDNLAIASSGLSGDFIVRKEIERHAPGSWQALKVVTQTSTPDASLLALMEGKLDALIATEFIVMQMRPSIRKKLHTYTIETQVHTPAILASPNATPHLIDRYISVASSEQIDFGKLLSGIRLRATTEADYLELLEYFGDSLPPKTCERGFRSTP